MAGGAGSLCLDGVLKQRGTTQIVLPLTNDVAEFLEEGLQLLLLGGRGQEAGDVDWKRLVVVESQRWRRSPECPRFARYVGEEVQGGGCGSRPTLRVTSKRRHSGHKCR